MNLERVYSTSLTADQLARALADHFHAQGFDTQVFQTPENRTVMQARKENLWRQALGVAYAITVAITPSDGRLQVALGGDDWVDTAVSTGIGLLVLPPVLLGTAYGVWKENQLDREVWRVVDEQVDAAPSPLGQAGVDREATAQVSAEADGGGQLPPLPQT